MTRFGSSPRLIAACLATLLVLPLVARVRAVDPPGGSVKTFADATDAWGRGDYLAALNGYLSILNGTDSATYLDRIALQTGELYRSFELTTDGRNGRFSPDGRYISYETGLEVSRRTRVVRNDASHAIVADLPGIGLGFAPAGSGAAYLRVTDTPELQAAAQAVEAAALTASNRGGLVQLLGWHVLKNTTLTTLDLETRSEREIATPSLLKTGLAWPVGSKLYFLGRPETSEDRNDLYAVDATSGRVEAVSGIETPFKGIPALDPSGRYLVFPVATQDALRRPPSIAPPPGVVVAVAASGPVPQPQASFVVFDGTTGEHVVRQGTAPALSRDAATLAYIERSASESRIRVGPPLGETLTARSMPVAAGRLDAPALSADGSRLAYQAMTRDDWELFVSKRDGSEEIRLTRDPQHDLLPQFVAGDRLLEVIGEPRHRRSFLIDPTTAEQTRLFHNNTVRTIAPEYQWLLSKDANQILIAAERDGNTVSPERGIYLIDLRLKVSKQDLLQRLQSNLASERTLRESQTTAFAPIAKEVREAVNDVSVSRIYAYEKALFGFDSKHISRPGNQRAAEYLFNTYASFGYEPEYQWFDNRQAAGGRTANVVVRLPGTVNPELVYVVSSHFDSVAVGPGADDDSSGTAALLETARVMASRPQPATIIFASFTGEEAGLLGSQEFVRRAVASKQRIVGALNNDMIGWANDSRLDNTIRYSNPGIRDIQHGAAMLFTRLITYDALYFKGTDAVSYYNAYGDIVGGIGSYPVLSSPHYHQPHDLLEFENHDQIAETGKATVATLIRLASSPSRISGLRLTSYADRTASVVWEPSPEKGVTSYTVTITGPGLSSARTTNVNSPRATITNVAPASVIAVKAVNGRGLDGWDAARVDVR